MITIVGLGNPGSEYARTRHNVGWIVLAQIITKHNLVASVADRSFSGLVTEGTLYTKEVGILFPTTFMNNTGVSVQRYLEARGALSDLIVVHDEVDLPFGTIRISFDRGAGGHNGVKSVIDCCGSTAFTRVRIGVAEKGFFGGIKRPTGERLADFVLQPFRSREMKQLPEITEQVERALELLITQGKEKAMQEINSV